MIETFYTAEDVYMYAMRKKDILTYPLIHKLIDLLVESKNPYYIYLFAKNVVGIEAQVLLTIYIIFHNQL